ncbi:MAG: 50S ribosomal protein L6 [Calditrichaeota bacterium]|nr:MAG: 50S ribosomal protein L6 [Calditrichota bacterium]
MSRVGKKVIELPAGVTVSRDGQVVSVKGPKGELAEVLNSAMEIKIDGNQLTVERPSDSKEHRALHGLSRSLVANMVEGVTNGFEKKLEIRGIGYRAEMRGDNVLFNLGFSHPIIFIPPKSITVKAEGNTNITVSGIDKELVGHVAAKIRTFRKPEPYKGKGIRYVGEYVREKAGKTAGK